LVNRFYDNNTKVPCTLDAYPGVSVQRGATHRLAGYCWCEALRGDKDVPIPEIKNRKP